MKKHENVIVIINNPCLEFWFLLHFENSSKFFDTCAKAETKLKQYLKDYEKTQKYFTKQDSDIYLKLKPYLQDAITNSQKLGQFDQNDPYKALCEMYLLFQADELKKHYNN
ncbi:RloB domain-containing protein [Belliella filtrata]|uniref:RloB domain-containing protein n=1 Tax=Belliella filtrata TaxID=2923435 RepID=UPI00374D088A